jgi:hypothetical protein
MATALAPGGRRQRLVLADSHPADYYEAGASAGDMMEAVMKLTRLRVPGAGLDPAEAAKQKGNAMSARHAKQRKRRPGFSRRALPGRRGEAKYPLATIAYYGPDDRVPTKIAVGVFEEEGAEPIMQRWQGAGVAANPQVAAEISAFLQAHGVQQVAMTEGIIGCPHEEGIDFPAGQECPYCPFWKGKQGISVR